MVKKNIYYRVLAIATIFTGFLFILSVPEMMKTIDWVLLGATFFFLAYQMKREFSKLSEDRINEILFLSFFKKIGCDFSKE